MTHDLIRVCGARTNNPHGIDVDLPERQLTVITGVSGSGKPSLAFDTIAAEARRQLNAPPPAHPLVPGPRRCRRPRTSGDGSPRLRAVSIPAGVRLFTRVP